MGEGGWCLVQVGGQRLGIKGGYYWINHNISLGILGMMTDGRGKKKQRKKKKERGVLCMAARGGYVSERLSRLAVIIVLVVCFGECRFPNGEGWG